MTEVIKEKSGLGKKVGIGCLVLVAIIVVLIVIGALGSGSSNNSGNGAAADKSGTETAVVDVSAADLSTAFQDNEAKAKLAYGGKTLRVSGKVKDIDLDFSDKPVIKLAGAGDVQGMGITSDGKMTDVNVNGLANEDAAQVTKGAKMTFVCTGDVTEVMGSPQLSDCTISRK